MLCTGPAGISALCYLFFIPLHSGFPSWFTRLMQADLLLGDQDALWKILAEPLIIFASCQTYTKEGRLNAVVFYVLC